MSCPAHRYGGADATVTLRTTGGTFNLCDGCAEALTAAGQAKGKPGPLQSENRRPRCQCEHVDLFENGRRCQACGALKPVGESCMCFDNGCQ